MSEQKISARERGNDSPHYQSRNHKQLTDMNQADPSMIIEMHRSQDQELLSPGDSFADMFHRDNNENHVRSIHNKVNELALAVQDQSSSFGSASKDFKLIQQQRGPYHKPVQFDFANQSVRGNYSTSQHHFPRTTAVFANNEVVQSQAAPLQTNLFTERSATGKFSSNLFQGGGTPTSKAVPLFSQNQIAMANQTRAPQQTGASGYLTTYRSVNPLLNQSVISTAEQNLQNQVEDLRRALRQAENDYSKQNALMQQKIDFLELQSEEAADRERKLKKMHQQVVLSLNNGESVQQHKSTDDQQVPLAVESETIQNALKEAQSSNLKISQLQQDLEDSRDDFIRIRKEHKQERQELEKVVRELKINLEEQAIQAQRQTQELQLDKRQLENKIKYLTEQNNKLQEESEQRESSVGEVNRIKTALSHCERDKERIQNESRQAMRTLSDQHAQMLSQIETKEQERFQNIEDSFNQRQFEAQKKLKSLQVEHKSEIEEYENLKFNLEQKISQHITENQCQNDKILKLERQLHSIQTGVLQMPNGRYDHASPPQNRLLVQSGSSSRILHPARRSASSSSYVNRTPHIESTTLKRLQEENDYLQEQSTRLNCLLRDCREEAELARQADRKVSNDLQTQLGKTDEMLLEAHAKLNEKRKEVDQLEDKLNEQQRAFKNQNNELQSKIQELELQSGKLKQEITELKKNLEVQHILAHHSPIHKQKSSSVTQSRDLPHQLMLMTRNAVTSSLSGQQNLLPSGNGIHRSSTVVGRVSNSGVTTSKMGIGPGFQQISQLNSKHKMNIQNPRQPESSSSSVFFQQHPFSQKESSSNLKVTKVKPDCDERTTGKNKSSQDNHHLSSSSLMGGQGGQNASENGNLVLGNLGQNLKHHMSAFSNSVSGGGAKREHEARENSTEDKGGNVNWAQMTQVASLENTTINTNNADEITNGTMLVHQQILASNQSQGDRKQKKNDKGANVCQAYTMPLQMPKLDPNQMNVSLTQQNQSQYNLRHSRAASTNYNVNLCSQSSIITEIQPPLNSQKVLSKPKHETSCQSIQNQLGNVCRVPFKELKVLRSCQQMVDAASRIECASCLKLMNTLEFYTHAANLCETCPGYQNNSSQGLQGFPKQSQNIPKSSCNSSSVPRSSSLLPKTDRNNSRVIQFQRSLSSANNTRLVNNTVRGPSRNCNNSSAVLQQLNTPGMTNMLSSHRQLPPFYLGNQNIFHGQQPSLQMLSTNRSLGQFVQEKQSNVNSIRDKGNFSQQLGTMQQPLTQMNSMLYGAGAQNLANTSSAGVFPPIDDFTMCCIDEDSSMMQQHHSQMNMDQPKIMPTNQKVVKRGATQNFFAVTHEHQPLPQMTEESSASPSKHQQTCSKTGKSKLTSKTQSGEKTDYLSNLDQKKGSNKGLILNFIGDDSENEDHQQRHQSSFIEDDLDLDDCPLTLPVVASTKGQSTKFDLNEKFKLIKGYNESNDYYQNQTQSKPNQLHSCQSMSISPVMKTTTKYEGGVSKRVKNNGSQNKNPPKILNRAHSTRAKANQIHQQQQTFKFSTSCRNIDQKKIFWNNKGSKNSKVQGQNSQKNLLAKTSNLPHRFAKDLQILVPGAGSDFFNDNDEQKSSCLTSNNGWLGDSYKAFGKVECTSSKAGQTRYGGIENNEEDHDHYNSNENQNPNSIPPNKLNSSNSMQTSSLNQRDGEIEDLNLSDFDNGRNIDKKRNNKKAYIAQQHQQTPSSFMELPLQRVRSCTNAQQLQEKKSYQITQKKKQIMYSYATNNSKMAGSAVDSTPGSGCHSCSPQPMFQKSPSTGQQNASQARVVRNPLPPAKNNLAKKHVARIQEYSSQEVNKLKMGHDPKHFKRGLVVINSQQESTRENDYKQEGLYTECMENCDDYDAADFDLEDDDEEEQHARPGFIETRANETQMLRPNLLVNQDIKFSAFNFTTNKTSKKPVLPHNGRKIRQDEQVYELTLNKQANSSSPGAQVYHQQGNVFQTFQRQYKERPTQPKTSEKRPILMKNVSAPSLGMLRSTKKNQKAQNSNLGAELDDSRSLSGLPTPPLAVPVAVGQIHQNNTNLQYKKQVNKRARLNLLKYSAASDDIQQNQRFRMPAKQSVFQ